MSVKKIALSLFAIVLLIGLGVAAIMLSKPGDVRFEPTQGEQRDYRVNMRVNTQEGDGKPTPFNTESLIVQSVMGYRVDAAGPTMKVHIAPRFMRAESDQRELFSSARPEDLDDNPIPALMDAGFDLVINRDSGSTRLRATDRSAWARLERKAGGAPIDQLKQQMAAPSIAKTLPAREGERITVDDFQGMPALHMTVESVDDDSVTVSLTRVDDAPAASVSMGNATARIIDVGGRMKLDRDSGWIESLTLLSEQVVEQYGQTAQVQTTMTMDAVDDPALGSANEGLAQFSAISKLSHRSEGYDLRLPQAPSDARDRPLINPAERPFDNVDTDFHIDEDNALVLNVLYQVAEDENLGRLTLDGIVLRDANGEPLDIPMVLDSIAVNYERGLGTVVRLLPLGWNDAQLKRIAEVEATLGYQASEEPEHVELPLTDTQSTLRSGVAKAEATPTEDGWRVLLTGTDDNFYSYDQSATFPGLAARLSDQAYDGKTPSQQTLMARVGTPDSWVQQILVEGDGDAFGLALFQDMPNATQHEISFSSRAQRYSNRDLAPPERHRIDRREIEDGPLALDGIETRGIDQNQLRLTLPVGLGPACALHADAPQHQGHELVWRPIFQRHPDFQEFVEDTDAGDIEWILMTDDGVRVYFYDVDVQTTLQCPGQPAWKTAPASTVDNKPWLVDIAATLGDKVDPQRDAASFFRSARFLGAKGQALRPMRLDVSADEELASWAEETADATVADYLADDGTIRFWGRVESVQSVHFSGDAVEREWQDRLEGLE